MADSKVTFPDTHSASTCPGRNWLHFPGGKEQERDNKTRFHFTSLIMSELTWELPVHIFSETEFGNTEIM